MQGDSGFERLHLGHLLSGGHGLQGHTEQHQQDDVLDRPQPLMPGKRHGVLGHLQLAGNFVDQLLQGTERAQPAAVNRTAPEQHDAGNHRPEDEQHRVDQEGFPGKAADQAVHKGQHVHNGELPQCIPANEEQGVDQEAMANPAHHLRLLHQPVLEEQDEQQHQNTGTQHHQLELFLVPHLHPQRLFFQPFLFGQNRLGAGVILVRQLVFQREYREFAVQRAGLALDRQLQGPGSTRVKLMLLPGNKNGHLGKVRHALGIDIAEAVKVEIPEVEGVTKLANLHPVKDTATNVAGTFEGVLTIGHHRDGMLTVFQLGHQPLVLALAQQVAADGGGIQIGGVQVDQRVIPLIRCGSFHTFSGAALESVVYGTAGQQQPANGTISGQFFPGLVLERFGVYFRYRRALAACIHFDQAQLATYAVGGAHDHFVDHHHGHRGTGQAIYRHTALG